MHLYVTAVKFLMSLLRVEDSSALTHHVDMYLGPIVQIVVSYHQCKSLNYSNKIKGSWDHSMSMELRETVGYDYYL